MLEVKLESENTICGSLYFDQETMRSFVRLAPSVISISERFQPERRRVETFIEDVFARAYGAKIPKHYPTLMSVRNAAGNILAAVGFRSAAQGQLFLEQYIDGPIEAALSDAFSEDVSRKEIVEIGSLASAGSGASMFLIIALVAYLKQQGFRFPVVTATRTLRAGFRFLGIKAQDLAPADPAALTEGHNAWGTYYDTEPRVLTGTLVETHKRLEHYIPGAQNQNLDQMFTRLHPECVRGLS
ncbi:MAG: thermostable hemolysin [Alphaproteobacteria bacterium]|nr:thermostable hemolysin [Alphaproteobacteria bacterium]